MKPFASEAANERDCPGELSALVIVTLFGWTGRGSKRILEVGMIV
jgi:hypothetical protein